MTTTDTATTKSRRATCNHSPKSAPKESRAKAPKVDFGVSAVKRSTKPWAIFAAVALILAGGLGGYAVLSSSADVSQVFVMSEGVVRGDIIKQTDLTTIDVAAGQATAGFTIDQADSVIGRTAAVDLPEGSLVTASSVTDQLEVPAGQALVGVALTSSQMPATKLVAGDQVRFVNVAGANAPIGSTGDSGVSAVVSDTRFDEVANLTVVDVYVDEAVAGDLASRAANGSIVLYVVPLPTADGAE